MVRRAVMADAAGEFVISFLDRSQHVMIVLGDLEEQLTIGHR
jgi:hypothetical protein